MKGHIRKRSKGSWEIAVDIGKDPLTGRRRQHFETVRGNKRNAERRLAELVVEVEKGSYIKPKRLSLAECLQQWLDGYVKTNCSARTFDSYQSIVNRHLIPNLGYLPLAQVQPQHIQEYYARSLAGGRVDGKGALSARSVLHIHRILFQALNYAVRQGLLVRNVATLVDPPRARKAKMKTLTPQEVSMLLSAAQDTVYYPIIYTAVNTGLRQAELLGLRWHDLDLDLAALSVSQVLYKRRGICQYKEPKSTYSRRRLDLSPSLALFLRQYKNRQEAAYSLLGKPLREYDLVFGNANGNPMDPGTLTHNFTRIARKAGLPGTRFHDLRHTFASLMLLAGIHPKIVSEMLGHSSVAFTLDTYSHVIGGLQQAAVKRLDEVLQPELKRNQDVGKMLATDPEIDTASGQIRTDDRRFTKPLLYP
jgi:integrase